MKWPKFNKRPRLQEMDTGGFALIRPHNEALTSTFGRGGIPIATPLAKVSTGVVIPLPTALPVSVGGSTDLTYSGIGLENLSASGEASI